MRLPDGTALLAEMAGFVFANPGQTALGAATLLLAAIAVFFLLRSAKRARIHARSQASSGLDAAAGNVTASTQPSAHDRRADSVRAEGSSDPSGAADAERDRAVRVFISSTFVDMQRERDVLVKRTFPALRARFRERQIEVFEVDLRWGVTEEQVQSGRTIGVCLAEVDRCQPFFVAILGERYGSLLNPENLTEDLIASYPALASAAGRSLTEIEIMHGVLNRPNAAARALFFERDPKWLDGLDPEERAALPTEDRDGLRALADLKARARAAGVRILPYARPEDIGPAVEAALGALIEARFPEQLDPDEIARERRLHAAYARERIGGLVGATPYLEQLDAWARNPSRTPMLIAGASGGGKSTLIANWVARHASRAPGDFIFEHYLGASPDSADPARLAQRMWRWLNSATGEASEPPAEAEALLRGLPAHIMRAASRVDGRRIVIALDGLDKLTDEESLGWLPSETPENVLLLTSSLPGPPLAAAEWREWQMIEVRPFDEADRRTFIVERLHRWGKALSDRRIDQILADAKSGNPLFLRTLLDELRSSGVEADLDARLAHYLSAEDTAGLFALMLERLERDYNPHFVAAAASLVWASRAGLEEAELLEITGASPLEWSGLRNALGEALRYQSGRITFSHDFLSRAVEARYMDSEERIQATHLRLADRFAALPAGVRRREELPYQLFRAEAWSRLEAYLTDFNEFEDVFSRGASELMNYWMRLKETGVDPQALLIRAFERRAPQADNWSKTDLDLAAVLVAFLSFAMFSSGESLARLARDCVTASRRLLGEEHPDTLAAVSNLGGFQADAGEYRAAIETQTRVLEIRERTHGENHIETVHVLQKLAALHSALGEYEQARTYVTRAFETSNAKLGENHPLTWSVMEDASQVEHGEGDLERARLIQGEVLDRMLNWLSPSDPLVAGAMEKLGAILKDYEKYDEAAMAFEHALNNNTLNYGRAHPMTLRSMMGLGGVCLSQGNLPRAKELLAGAADQYRVIYGPDHPAAIIANENLAVVLIAERDFDAAEQILRRNVELSARVFGPEAPHTLSSQGNLASVYLARGNVVEAIDLYKNLEKIQTRSVGAEHPDTINTMGLLAMAYAANNAYAAAAEVASRELRAIVNTFGLEHPLTARTGRQLAVFRWNAGDRAGAIAAQRDLLDYLSKQFGTDDSRTKEAVQELLVMEGPGSNPVN